MYYNIYISDIKHETEYKLHEAFDDPETAADHAWTTINALATLENLTAENLGDCFAAFDIEGQPIYTMNVKDEFNKPYTDL